MVVCVDKNDVPALMEEAEKLGEKAYIIGETVRGKGVEL
jgi:phosphoribosylaminoimidazole (AIR) synthetase